MYTSWNTPWYVSNEQNANTKRFLLSPVALSSCRFNIGGSGFAGTSSASWGGRDDVHISAPTSKAINNGAEPLPENSSREEYFGGNSRSLSYFAIDPTVWFESVGKISSP